MRTSLQKNLQYWVVGSPVIHQLVEILFKFTPGCTPHFRVFLNVGCQPLFLVKLYYRVHLPRGETMRRGRGWGTCARECCKLHYQKTRAHYYLQTLLNLPCSISGPSVSKFSTVGNGAHVFSKRKKKAIRASIRAGVVPCREELATISPASHCWAPPAGSTSAKAPFGGCSTMPGARSLFPGLAGTNCDDHGDVLDTRGRPKG